MSSAEQWLPATWTRMTATIAVLLHIVSCQAPDSLRLVNVVSDDIYFTALLETTLRDDIMWLMDGIACRPYVYDDGFDNDDNDYTPMTAKNRLRWRWTWMWSKRKQSTIAKWNIITITFYYHSHFIHSSTQSRLTAHTSINTIVCVKSWLFYNHLPPPLYVVGYYIEIMVAYFIPCLMFSPLSGTLLSVLFKSIDSRPISLMMILRLVWSTQSIVSLCTILYDMSKILRRHFICKVVGILFSQKYHTLAGYWSATDWFSHMVAAVAGRFVLLSIPRVSAHGWGDNCNAFGWFYSLVVVSLLYDVRRFTVGGNTACSR